MTTSPAAIRRLWTHKTLDHSWLPDEALVVDHAEGDRLVDIVADCVAVLDEELTA
jgi:hypothetical protein